MNENLIRNVVQRASEINSQKNQDSYNFSAAEGHELELTSKTSSVQTTSMS